jgi:tetratricopeptide (TPR) repeat protein
MPAILTVVPVCVAVVSCCAAGFQQHAPGREGLLLACASKAASHQPLSLPPAAALAAALETRGHYTAAVAALRYCLALLQTGLQQGDAGLTALGLAPGLHHDPATALRHQLLLVPASGNTSGEQWQVLEGSSGAQAVLTALQLALARNLCLAGMTKESVELYQQLELDGAISTAAAGSSAASYSWLAYGAAAQREGQVQLAAKALQAALDAAAEPRVQLAAVTALLQVRPCMCCWGRAMVCVAKAAGGRSHVVRLACVVVHVLRVCKRAAPPAASAHTHSNTWPQAACS